MALTDFFKADLRQWYWFFKAGKSQKKGNFQDLRLTNFKQIPQLIFFLSTGRTGTAWFAELFEKDKNLIVFHQAVPSLAVQNKFYYNLLKNKDLDQNLKYEIGKEIFLTAREEYLLYSFKTQKPFLETNNDLIFFAEVILKTFPKVKFVHLYRHPGDVIRSGLIRGWYESGHKSNLKLIDFEGDNRIEKIAKLWTEVNSFVEKIKNENPEIFFNFNFNELNFQNVKNLTEFLDVKISENQIKKHLNKKVNVSKKYDIPKYKDWSEKDKEIVRKICGSLAKKYGYQL